MFCCESRSEAGWVRDLIKIFLTDGSPGPERLSAQRLKRVFWIDIETCQHCGGAVRVIASIEDPVVIEKILTHLERREAAGATPHAPRAPPAMPGGDLQ